MKYKLFIDDERYPTTNDWVISRNFDDTVWYITNYGMPFFISFDHDLGPNKATGMDIAKWIVNHYLDNEITSKFEFFVHSQNPVGAKNIQSYLDNFFEIYGG